MGARVDGCYRHHMPIRWLIRSSWCSSLVRRYSAPTFAAVNESLPIQAALFDMDGLLIDSEPLWQDAEIEVFASYGLLLTREDCRRTMGRRVDEVVAYWQAQHPGLGTGDAAIQHVATEIVDRVVALIQKKGAPMPGVQHALDTCSNLGLRCAVASSSYERLIQAVVEHLDINHRFEVLYSAQYEAQGKPHPGVFLTTAAKLGVAPEACVVLEDSPNGVRAALAAGMRCIAVPDHGVATDPIFDKAHVRLHSLERITAADLLG